MLFRSAEVGAFDLGPGSRHQPSGDIGRAIRESTGLQGGQGGWSDLSDKAVVAAGARVGGGLERAGSGDQARADGIAGDLDVAGGIDGQPGGI